VPIAGKYRIIDFPLSNAVNSKLNRIAVLAQFHASSLVEYLGAGEPWGLDESSGGSLQIWQPSRGRTEMEHYLGTADAVYQNREFIAEDGSDLVVVLAGDHIFRQDFREMIRFHQENGADLTISSLQVPLHEAHRFGIMTTDSHGRILTFDEKVENPPNTLASMGIYVFNSPYLLALLAADARNPDSHHDFGNDIIPLIVDQRRAFAYPNRGYWLDIGTLEAYWQSNMDLLGDPPAFELHDPNWVIHTRPVELPPAAVMDDGEVHDSLICDGCVIRGQVFHSVLSPGVVVEAGAVINDSVILDHTIIASGAVVDHCVIDQEAAIGENSRLGFGDDNTPNQENPLLKSSITFVGRQAGIPTGTIIGRNCLIEAEITPADFDRLITASGSTVRRKTRD
jgi:glucose-1-phosphate adenylyltransferase